jgi:cytochrome c2
MVGGRGNRLSVNLDRPVIAKAPDVIAGAILHPAQGMPEFRMEARQIDNLITALLASSARSPKDMGDQRQIVHFNRDGAAGKDIFSVKCGGCHRALTQRHGSLGSGDAGPNLSGLLSPFYPATYREREPWTEERLREWLKNPRRVRSTARMQPVTVTEREFKELVYILGAE